MVSYGVTEDVQLSASVPLLVGTSRGAPVRGLMRMPATRDAEFMVGWRFQRTATGVGARMESTLWLALDQPLGSVANDPERPRSFFGAAATGYASRRAYVWLGAGYGGALDATRPAGRAEERVVMGSLVVGYRPGRFRGEYPSPDWRGFIEVVGERRRRVGDEAIGDGLGLRRELTVALTVLGLYGSWGIAGGPALPVYRDGTGGAPAERVRLVLNGILWF
jgi:hypothetical protein